jgi:hypothetical protein
MQRRWLAGRTIALSVSAPEDIAERGMGQEHLDDALGEISRQLLALGAQLIYGGDLRVGGITKLLFELATRYAPPLGQEGSGPPAVVDVLAFPMHAELTPEELTAWESAFAPIGQLRYLGPAGEEWSFMTRPQQLVQMPKDEWPTALTAMRKYVTQHSAARIVLGGRLTGYLGRMPGIAEEAFVSSAASQPLFVIGGFGGAAEMIARRIESNEPVPLFGTGEEYRVLVKNGLDETELLRLAASPHIDEIALLVVRGLARLFAN